MLLGSLFAALRVCVWEQVVAVRDVERKEIRPWSRSGPQISPLLCILTDVEVLSPTPEGS